MFQRYPFTCKLVAEVSCERDFAVEPSADGYAFLLKYKSELRFPSSGRIVGHVANTSNARFDAHRDCPDEALRAGQ